MTPGLQLFTNDPQLVPDARQHFIARGGWRRFPLKLEFMTAHPSIEEIADFIELPHADDRFFRTRTAGRGLDLNCAEPEPPLKNIARNVNVLAARVGQIRFAAPKQSVRNRDSLLVEAVAQRDVATKERQESERKRHIGHETVDEIERQQFAVGPRQREDVVGVGIVEMCVRVVMHKLPDGAL